MDIGNGTRRALSARASNLGAVSFARKGQGGGFRDTGTLLQADRYPVKLAGLERRTARRLLHRIAEGKRDGRDKPALESWLALMDLERARSHKRKECQDCGAASGRAVYCTACGLKRAKLYGKGA